MSTRTFADLLEFAPELVAEYCSETGGFAWPLYDDDFAPGTLSGADLTAPALLSYPIKLTFLNEMGREPAAGLPPDLYRDLYRAMVEFVETPAATTFADLGRDAVVRLGQEPSEVSDAPEDWQRFVRCLELVQACKGLTSVAVTKILHRKRPDLIPINDSLLRCYYGSGRSYSKLFLSIFDDLDAHGLTLRKIARTHRLPSGRVMTELRALDIAIWMFQRRA